MDSQKKVLNVKRACHNSPSQNTIRDISNYNSTSRNSIRDIFKCIRDICKWIADIYKCIRDISKKMQLEISLIVFWLVKSYLKISAIDL